MSVIREASVRASSIHRVLACPGSADEPVVAVREESDPARLGTAAHEALRDLVAYDSVAWDGLPALAARHGVDEDELRMLCAFATKMWPALSTVFKGGLTEMEFVADISPRITLTGHVDLMSDPGGDAAFGSGIVHLGDWKSGRKDSDYSEQVKAYATLVMYDDASINEVRMTVIWLRDAEIQQYTFTRAQAEEWEMRLRSVIDGWDGTYRPGAHCYGCQRSHECGAMNAIARRDAAIVLDVDVATALQKMTPSEIVALHVRAKDVASRAKTVTDAIRTHVENMGPIACESGMLSLLPEDRREVDVAKAWGVLQDIGFKDEDFADVIDMSMSRIEKRVATKAGKGKGAAAIRALTTQMEAAGAVQKNQIYKLTLKP